MEEQGKAMVSRTKDLFSVSITGEDGRGLWVGKATDVEDAIRRAGFTLYPYRWLGVMDDALARAVEIGVDSVVAQVVLFDGAGIDDCVCVTSINLDPMPWELAEVVKLHGDREGT